MADQPQQTLWDAYNVRPIIKAKKQSAITMINTLPELIRRATSCLKETLVKEVADFRSVPDEVFACVTLDKSLFNRPEYDLPRDVHSNKMLAFVGDAFLRLALYVSKLSFRDRDDEKKHNERQQHATSTEQLAAKFDELFPEGCPLVVWDPESKGLNGSLKGIELQASQKAECMEAIVGALFETGRGGLANWVCKRVLSAPE